MEYEPVRFNEMQRYLGRISDKTLSQHLKELERDTDLIKDTIYMNWNAEINYVMAIKKGYAEKLRSGNIIKKRPQESHI